MVNRKYPNWSTEKIIMKNIGKSAREIQDTVKGRTHIIWALEGQGEWDRSNIWRYNGQGFYKFEEWYQCTNSWNSATDLRNNHKQHK